MAMAGMTTSCWQMGVTVTGAIDGGANSTETGDTLDFNAITTTRNVTLTNAGATDGFDGDEAAITGGFDNIDTLIGGTAGDDSLTGINAAATWEIDGTNSYTSTNTLVFSEIENLTGNAADDTFRLTGGTLENMLIDGGGETVEDLVDVSLHPGAVIVDLQDLTSIERVMGEDGDTLRGTDGADTFTLTATKHGYSIKSPHKF